MKGISLLLLALLFSTSAQAEETSSVIVLSCVGSKTSHVNYIKNNTVVFSIVFKITLKDKNNNPRWQEWDAESGRFVAFVTKNDSLHISPLKISSLYEDKRGGYDRYFEDEIDRKTGIYSSNLLIVSHSGSTGGHKINAQCEPTTEPQPEKAKF